MRYDLRKLNNGWAVWDTHINVPISRCHADLDMEDAGHMLELLNRLDREASTASMATSAGDFRADS